jgi:hypothetical protein
MVLDRAGNLYLGDLTRNALGVIGRDRRYRELAAGLPWVDDLEFGPDGALYVVTTQLERAPELNAEVDASRAPWVIYRVQPLAPGRQGYEGPRGGRGRRQRPDTSDVRAPAAAAVSTTV